MNTKEKPPRGAGERGDGPSDGLYGKKHPPVCQNGVSAESSCTCTGMSGSAVS